MPDYPIDPATGKIRSLRPVDFVDPPDDLEPEPAPIPPLEPDHIDRFRRPQVKVKNPFTGGRLFKNTRRVPGIDGDKVREYRHRAGLTQMQASAISKVAAWGVLELSKGRIPRPTTLQRICGVLGVTPDMIANDGTPIPPPPPPPDPIKDAYQAGYDKGYGEGYTKGRADAKAGVGS